jgi:hypothetical protein
LCAEAKLESVAALRRLTRALGGRRELPGSYCSIAAMGERRQCSGCGRWPLEGELILTRIKQS